MNHDKRKHSRSAVSLETIYFTKGLGANNAEHMYYPGTITNTSDDGIGLRANHPHALNDQIWLDDLTIANRPRLATVRWVNNNDSNDNEYLIGLEFNHKMDVRQ